MCEASKQAVNKAKRNPSAMMPVIARPQTCPQTARRMVTGALGLKLKSSREEREKERLILREARGKNYNCRKKNIKIVIFFMHEPTQDAA